MSGSIEVLDPLTIPNWDDLLRGHAHASVFHTAGWARVLHEAYDCRPVYLGSHNGRSLRCLLPVMEIRSWVRGRRGISLPFADYCEPLADTIDEFRSLTAAAVEEGRRRNWRYFEWRGGCNQDGDPAFMDCLGAEPSIRLLGHVVDLRYDEEAMFRRLDSSMRRGIRKAQEAGVTVEFRTDAEAMREYYRLHGLTRRNKHGLPPQPWRFFQKIQEHLVGKGMGFVALARVSAARAGDPGSHAKPETAEPSSAPLTQNTAAAIAGAVFLNVGGAALYKFGASDDAHLDLRPNNLLMWQALLHCKRLGCRSTRLGRTDLRHKGLRRFKQGWGAREERIDYYKLEVVSGRWLTERDLRFGWHNRVFGALPLWANRLAGEILYPHLD